MLLSDFMECEFYKSYENEGHPSYLCDNSIDSFNMGAIISQEKKNAMTPFLKSNLGIISQREISRRLGIGKTTVNRWSTEMGFEHVKYTANEDFFNEWNEEMSYILGYVFADGNVSWNPEKSYHSMTITASEKDHEHLEKIRGILSSTKPLTRSEKTRSHRLIVNSRQMCKKLMSIGVLPRKSLTVEFPEVPKSLMRHFVRGVIDGDGTVRYVDRKKSPYFEILISSGSERFIDSLRDVISDHVGVDSTVRKVGKSTYTLQYSCSRGKKLAEWVYHDSDLFLVRKFKKYKMALDAERRCVSL